MNNISATSLKLSSRLQQATKRESSALKELSTGKNLGEGGASHALLLKAESSLTSAARGLEQASLNVSNASAMNGIAEGGLQNVLNNLQSLRSLAVQAADGTLSASDRSGLQTRANDLVAGIDSTAGKSDFNGTKLLDGSFSGKSVQVGASEGNSFSVSLPDSSSSELGGSVLSDFSTAAASGDAITAIDAAISQVTSSMANVGATGARLESASSSNGSIAEQLAAASSVLADTDYAKAFASLKTSEIQVKAAALLLTLDSASHGTLVKTLIK